MYLHSYRLDLFHQKIAIEESLLFEEYWVKTLTTLIFHWNLGIEVARSSYNQIIWSQLDFEIRFSPKMLPWLLSSKSQSSVFYFSCIFLMKNVTPHPFSGILADQNWQKVLFVLTCLGNLIFIQLYLLHFHFNKSIHSFLIEADGLSIKKIMKFVFCIGFGVLIDRIWQKLYYCWFS